MLFWRLLTLTFGGPAANICSNAAQKANGASGSTGTLSVGSKLEVLLRAFVFAKCP